MACFERKVGRRLHRHVGLRGFSLSLSVADPAEAERRFAALADGGQVLMPLGETFFATRFGMVADHFGVPWMVIAMKRE